MFSPELMAVNEQEKKGEKGREKENSDTRIKSLKKQ